jgi:hypothetical protein
MFTLDIGIKDKDLPVNVFIICDEIDQTLEKHSESSGYCFMDHIRDMQFKFNTKLEVEEAEKKVKEIFTKYNLEISKTDSYISVYDNEENE